MREAAEPIRVLLADKHEFFRRNLRQLLEGEGLEVVGEATNVEAATAMASKLLPDVILLDISLTGAHGPVGAETIAVISTTGSVVVLTASAGAQEVVEALRAGVSSYLLKSSSLEQLLLGIESAVVGQAFLSPSIARLVLQELRAVGELKAPPDVAPGLTQREREILRLLAGGKNNAEIAHTLSISPNTVKNTVSRVFGKLSVRNRVEAAVLAARQGILD